MFFSLVWLSCQKKTWSGANSSFLEIFWLHLTLVKDSIYTVKPRRHIFYPFVIQVTYSQIMGLGSWPTSSFSALSFLLSSISPFFLFQPLFQRMTYVYVQVKSQQGHPMVQLTLLLIQYSSTFPYLEYTTNPTFYCMVFPHCITCMQSKTSDQFKAHQVLGYYQRAKYMQTCKYLKMLL